MEAREEMNLVDEPKVEFRSITDRITYVVTDPAVDNKVVVEISGYDLDFSFNLELIRSIEDVEAVLAGLTDMFRDKLMSELLGQNFEK